MIRRMCARLLPFLCFLILSMLLLSVPAYAQGRWILGGYTEDQQPQSVTLVDKTLYVLTNSGLLAYEAKENGFAEDATGSRVELGDISINTLLTHDESLLLIDFDSQRVYSMQQGKIQQEMDFSGMGLSSNAYDYSYPTCQDGYIFLITSSQSGMPAQTNLIRLDLKNSAVKKMDIKGLTQLSAYVPGELLAVWNVDNGSTSTREIVTVDTGTGAVVQHVRQFDSLNDGGLAYSGQSDTIYTILDGMLYRKNQSGWEKLRPYHIAGNAFFFDIFQNQYICGSLQGVFITDTQQDSSQTVLTIKGLFPGMDMDDDFQQAYPNICISRSHLPSYSAQDVDEALQSGDDTTDLFLIPLSQSMLTLMEKGYLAPLSSSATLVKDNSRLYGNIASPLSMNGTLYAVPCRIIVYGWMMQKDLVDLLPMPRNIQALIDRETGWDDEPLNKGEPLIAKAYSNEPWQRSDYAAYMLDQYLRVQSAFPQAVDFSNPQWMGLLEAIATAISDTAGDTAGATISDSDSSVMITDKILSVYGFDYSQMVIVQPPILYDGAMLSVPASLHVYVINPYSKNQAEAITYLEYMATHREQGDDGLLCTDITEGTIQPTVKLTLDDLREEYNEAILARETVLPEHKAELEEQIDSLKTDIESKESDPNSWLIYQPALESYRNLIAPYLDFGLNLYLEKTDATGISAYSNMLGVLDQYIEGAIPLDLCVQKLNAIASIAYREGGM